MVDIFHHLFGGVLGLFTNARDRLGGLVDIDHDAAFQAAGAGASAPLKISI